MVKATNNFLQSFRRNQNLNTIQFDYADDLVVIREVKAFHGVLITLQPMKLILI